jgi:hypothetical protein
MERPYEGEEPTGLVPQGKLQPGETIPGVFQSKKPIENWVTLHFDSGGWKIWVMGWISYVDENQVPRRTSFCREWHAGPPSNPQNGHFEAVANPDYEHEE